MWTAPVPRLTETRIRIVASLALLACTCMTRAHAQEAPAGPAFGQEVASGDVRQLAHWIVLSADNKEQPFVIVDKKMAKVFVFRPDGQLRGAAPVLLGLSRGDDTVPGIGERKLSTIGPEERTTPAGRFVASLGTNLQGKDILWVDYEAAISMHRVVTSNAAERRAQRLASPSPLDNRISYGCINVPVKFYEHVLSPSFKQSSGIVYILPDRKSMAEAFTGFDASLMSASSPR